MKRIAGLMTFFLILALLGTPVAQGRTGPQEVLKKHQLSTGSGTPNASTASPAKDRFTLRRTTEAEAPTAQDPEKVKKLQRVLKAKGLYKGRIDGWFGPYTQAAVMDYQRDNKSWVSGVVDQDLYGRIVSSGATSETSGSGSGSSGSTASSRKTDSSGWVTVDPIVYKRQQTGYTCGPTSLSMALAVFGVNLSESWLANAAGTSGSGTGHSGLFQAVGKANKSSGKNVKIWDQKFSSTGWDGLQKFISGNNPVIINLKSWFGSWGHYVMLAGINMKTRQVKLADPSAGSRVVSFSEMEWRMKWHSSPSLIPLSRS